MPRRNLSASTPATGSAQRPPITALAKRDVSSRLEATPAVADDKQKKQPLAHRSLGAGGSRCRHISRVVPTCRSNSPGFNGCIKPARLPEFCSAKGISLCARGRSSSVGMFEVDGSRCRIPRTVSPSMSGNVESSTIRSGAKSRACLIACNPPPASKTLWPA